MEAKTHGFKAQDGYNIPAVIFGDAAWLDAARRDEKQRDAERPVKGVVVISHGFGEHIGRYREFAAHLVDAGYACVVFDQRGHGELSQASPQKRKELQGIIPRYQTFLDDLAVVVSAVKTELPGIPIALYGHSMGGNIAINYLLRIGQADFCCVLLEAPWLGLYKELSPVTVCFVKAVGKITAKATVINQLSRRDITTEAEKGEEIERDPLYHNQISLRMLAGILDGCAYALRNAAHLSVATHLACASGERIVSNTAIQAFAAACESRVTLREYNSNHSIHNDTDRERYCNDIVAFLDAHCRFGSTL